MRKIKKNKIILTIISINIIIVIGIIIYSLNKNNILKMDVNQEKLAGNLEITYRKIGISSDKSQISLLITVTGDEGISKIIKPDGTEIMPVDNRNEMALDYTVDSGKDYKFKVLDKTGKEEEDIINITIGEICSIEDLEEINLDLVRKL